MSCYQRILLVTDLREDCGAVVERAKAIVQSNDQAHLTILHIVEEAVLTTSYELIPIMPVDVQNESETTSQVRQRVQDLMNQYDLKAKIQVDSALSTPRGIIECANKLESDLIVIGRHTRTGLASFLGSTADDILPLVKCDVLVVKLGDPV